MPHPVRRRGNRSPLLAALTALAGLALTGCGLAPVSGSGPEHERSGPGAAAPSLADVDALTDPRSWTGGTTAVLGDDAPDPVQDDPRPRLPVTLTDAQGTRVTVTDASRVLALDVYGTLARTVAELGLGDSLVGRDVSTTFAGSEQLPLVTHSGHDLNAEAILELDPTVILTDTSLGPWDVVLQMRDAGIPVVVTDSERGLDNLDAITDQVATALGVPEAGRRLADRVQAEVDAVRAEVAAIAPSAERERLRTVFLYVRGQSGVYYLFGEDSGADALIDALGLYDVAEEIDWSGMRPVTDEAIIAAQPELVLMMSGGLESVDGVEGLLEQLPALAETPAGEQRRFVDMADSQVLGFGPTTAAVLNALAVAVYAPEAVS